MNNAATMAQGTTTCTPTSVYVQQHDGTGKIAYDLTKYPALQQQAITLAKAFPDPYCSAFKVYDYGFTPILQYTKGGYAEAFETMKLQCMGADRKQPYLLFVREVNQAGQVTKVWVDVNLPTDGNFACLKDINRSLIKIRVEKVVNDVITKTPTLEVTAQVVGMEKLREEVVKIVDCCVKKGTREDKDCKIEGCVFSPESIFELISKDRATTSELLFVDKDNDFSTIGILPKPTKLNITVKDRKQSAAVDLDDFIDNYVSDFSKEIESRFNIIPTIKVIKYKYPRDCDDITQSLIDFDNSSAHFVLHVGFINIDNDAGILTLTTSSNFTPTISTSFNRSSNDYKSAALKDELEGLQEAKAGKECSDLIAAILGQGGAYKLKYANDNYEYYRPEVKRTIEAIVKRAESNVKQADEAFAPLWAKEHDAMLKWHKQQKHYFSETRATLDANWNTCGNAIHTILDMCGLIEPIGILCDGTNTLLYLAGGDYQNAALSAVAIIPLVGSSATVSKYGGKLWRAVGTTATCLSGNKASSNSELMGDTYCRILSYTVKAGKLVWSGGRGKLSQLMIANEQYLQWVVNGKVYKFIQGATSAHHIIPWEYCFSSQHNLIKWLAQSGWHPSNPILNGFPVPNGIHLVDDEKHHVFYNKYVKKRLDKLVQEIRNDFSHIGDIESITDKQVLKDLSIHCRKKMEALTKELSEHIDGAIQSNTPLNIYFQKFN